MLIAMHFEDSGLRLLTYDHNVLGAHPRLSMEVPQIYIKPKGWTDNFKPLFKFDNQEPRLEYLANFIKKNSVQKSIKNVVSDDLDQKF